MTELSNSYNLLSDTVLAHYAKDGDDNAFEELVVRYLDTINYIAHRFSAGGYEQNDFVQEGLLGLLYSCRTYDENADASFKSYMSLVVERRFVSIIRRSNALRKIPRSSLVQIDDISDSIQDYTYNPEDLLICNEHLKIVLDKLKSTLSGVEYDVLMLYGNGMSYKEIANKLSVTTKAVDNALQRARKKINSRKITLSE